MKYSIFLILIVSTIPLYAQEIDGTMIKLVEEVSEPEGLQAELHEKVLNWYGVSFNNAEEVITSNTASSIVGRYINSFIFGGTSEVNWSHTIQTDVKDNKARIQIWINNITADPVKYFYNNKGEPRNMYKKGLEKLNNDAQSLNESFQKALVDESDDDW